MVFGPDGNLYVTSHDTGEILRYDGTTGAFLGIFSSVAGVPQDLVFGPDGNLYVSAFNVITDAVVLRFNGTTGAFVDVFASGGGLTGPYGLAFGPDGNLYVSSVYTNQVLRYNGTTGAFVDIFASGGGLNFPTFLTFTPAAPIPEPATSVVLVTALAGLALANKLRAARMHRYGQHRN